jgi:hypothetical protein
MEAVSMNGPGILAKTLRLTLTAVVELDVAVEVEPIVDLDLDLDLDLGSRSSTRIRRPQKVHVQGQGWTQRPTSPFRSTSCDNVKVDV